MSLEVIKSYLVKLGVDVDNKTFDQSKKVLGELDNTLGGMVKNMINSVPAGAISMVSALAFVDTAIVKSIMNVSEANLQYELLAKRMYLSVDAAKAFKLATDAIGENIQDIAWNAELKSRYFALVRDINSLRVPGEAKDLFKQVRALDFLFTRLKTSGKPFLEWVSYELLKLNKGTLQDISVKVGKFVENFLKNIPKYSKSIAEFLQIPIQLTKSFLEVLKGLWDLGGIALGGFVSLLKEIWNILPNIGKEITLLGVALGPVFLAGSPILAGALAFLATLLLIDDAMTFSKGGKSLDVLKPVWGVFKDIADFINKLIITIDVAIDYFSGRLKNISFKDALRKQLDIYDGIKEEESLNSEDLKGKPENFKMSENLPWWYKLGKKYGPPGYHIDQIEEGLKLEAQGVPLKSAGLWNSIKNAFMDSLEKTIELHKEMTGTEMLPAGVPWEAPSTGTFNTFNMSVVLQDYVSPSSLTDSLMDFKKRAEEEAKAQNIKMRIKTKVGAN